jgi:hypothetical protein
VISILSLPRFLKLFSSRVLYKLECLFSPPPPIACTFLGLNKLDPGALNKLELNLKSGLKVYELDILAIFLPFYKSLID